MPPLAMVLQFPPLPPSEDDLVDEGDQSTRVELLETDPGDHDSQPDMSRDILWVYENLARKGVTARDAPSLGAWSLLIWARQDRNRFFEQMLPKAMASIEKKTKEDSGLVEYDGGFKDLDKMLADHQLQWERDAVADMDATIKKTVLSRVGDWECRFHLELAPDARESWALKMMRIVDEAITAMTKHHAESQAV
jgi:hypothetical protein